MVGNSMIAVCQAGDHIDIWTVALRPRLPSTPTGRVRRRQMAIGVFTHGDLSSLNIWSVEMNSFWTHEIDKLLQPMLEELAVERARQRYFGDFG
ncbi:hypothetical protein TSTA_085480 [Talaromyces stipitatus ATCC 10500]|uniref:Uncharacterized protein n=1 Tax=Talaromyces stipitatus (strain ATCC 10500 / CBS 375.48 / QM 6759 / NRRL 1006) TaxID=441959 RepID=B8M1T9_TALSN|nr:uncharacterized protein TSTA_085480 [Talaromyces stipitatus ATCC 10500]EED21317.1 hypothetical protein TSTA_085480 [Talaromyces stipitatus ATCC 10500]